MVDNGIPKVSSRMTYIFHDDTGPLVENAVVHIGQEVIKVLFVIVIDGHSTGIQPLFAERSQNTMRNN